MPPRRARKCERIATHVEIFKHPNYYGWCGSGAPFFLPFEQPKPHEYETIAAIWKPMLDACRRRGETLYIDTVLTRKTNDHATLPKPGRSQSQVCVPHIDRS